MTPSRVAIWDRVIEKGLAYLEQHQYPSGEFCAYVAPDDATQQRCIPDSNVFITALAGGFAMDRRNYQRLFAWKPWPDTGRF